MERKFDAVLFDAVGTLFRVFPSVGAVYAEEAVRFGVEVPPPAIDAAFQEQWELTRPTPGRPTALVTSEEAEQAFWRHLVYAVFRDCCGRDAFGDRFETFFQAIYRRFAQPAAWELFDDVVPALDALDEAGVRCAVVSNFDARLPALLEAMGLAPRFAFILTSAQIGRRKPDPYLFDYAVQRLGTEPARTLCVGDTFEDDVVGAQSAGLFPLLIDRTNAHGPSQPTSMISRLTDLRFWVDGR